MRDPPRGTVDVKQCFGNLGKDVSSVLQLGVLALFVMVSGFQCNSVRANDMGDFGQSQTEAILALDADYFARLAADPSSIEAMLHEEFRYLTHFQTELSKPRLLAYLRQSPGLVETFKLGDRYVFSTGDLALVWGTVQTQGQHDGFESVTSRYWHVWHKHDSQWFLLRRQAGLLERENR